LNEAQSTGSTRQPRELPRAGRLATEGESFYSNLK
jgi:hypothetical protein